jgi:hypothetical protein
MDKWIGKDLEESGRGLTEGTILTFASTNVLVMYSPFRGAFMLGSTRALAEFQNVENVQA